MISALKHKDIKSIIVSLLKDEGKEEQAKEVEGANRITSALIDRTCVADVASPEDEVFDEPLPEFAEQACCDAEEEEEEDTEPCCIDEDTANELIAIDKDIKALLAKGKGKKALKLIKAAMEMGVKGSVIKEQMEEAKRLKKESK